VLKVIFQILMEKWKGFGLESSNFEPGLQAKYPEIRAFAGKNC
jgi:hypothetical protein